MNVLELRNLIQSLLADEIGTYTLPGNVPTPAIVVLSSGESISDRTVTGLEVVIRRSPIRDEGKAMFDCVRAAKTWQVFLVQWQGEYTIDTARDKLRQKFPNLITITIPVEKGSAIREQVSVRIADDVEAIDWL